MDNTQAISLAIQMTDKLDTVSQVFSTAEKLIEWDRTMDHKDWLYVTEGSKRTVHISFESDRGQVWYDITSQALLRSIQSVAIKTVIDQSYDDAL